MRKKNILTISLVMVMVVSWPTVLLAVDVDILSLDASRTGDENEVGGDRYLTSPAMADATNILLNAGFTIGTTSRFYTANITGAKILYTGAVDVAFSAQEISDIQAFVNAGGGLVMQRDWGAFYPAADPLAAAFGATYNPGPFGISGTPTAVNMSLAHPIWNGPAGSVTLYDQGFSSSVSGVTGIGTHSTNPSQIGLAVSTYGAGRVVFLTDMNAWDSFGDPITPLPGNNNAVVWENTFHWTIPEPSTMFLLGLGGLALLRNRRFR